MSPGNPGFSPALTEEIDQQKEWALVLDSNFQIYMVYDSATYDRNTEDSGALRTVSSKIVF